MKFLIKESQLDKRLRYFFNSEFKDSKLKEFDSKYGGGKWYGVVNSDGILLVGHPSHDSSIWFTNGEYFSGFWDIFGVDPQDFNESLGRYIEKKFDIKISRIY